MPIFIHKSNYKAREKYSAAEKNSTNNYATCTILRKTAGIPTVLSLRTQKGCPRCIGVASSATRIS